MVDLIVFLFFVVCLFFFFFFNFFVFFLKIGKEAVEAANVFYYLTYEGEIDLDSVTDEVNFSLLYIIFFS